jgi:hypothetical protein
MLAAPLLGRQRETTALASLVDTLRAGRGGAVVVEGPAGIGESRLLAEAANMAHEAGIVVAADAQMRSRPASRWRRCCPLPPPTGSIGSTPGSEASPPPLPSAGALEPAMRSNWSTPPSNGVAAPEGWPGPPPSKTPAGP